MGPPHRYRAPPAGRCGVALWLLAAAAAALALAPAPARASVRVISAGVTFSEAPPLASPPWYRRSEGVDYVNLRDAADTKGDNIDLYVCSAPTAVAPCSAWAPPSPINGPWYGDNFPNIIDGDAFNGADFMPLTAAATRQFSSISYFEMFIEEGGQRTPVARYATRNVVAPVNAPTLSNFTLFPVAPEKASMMSNILVRLDLAPGSYKWGFRSQGANGLPADILVTTRVFFGCVGPNHTATSSVSAKWDQPLVTIKSGVGANMPDATFVPPSAVTWTGVCFNGKSKEFTGSGYDFPVTIGPAGMVVPGTLTNVCPITFVARTSKGCPLTWTVTLSVSPAPKLTPVIEGAPNGTVQGPFPKSVTLTAVSKPNPIAGNVTAYTWRVDCGGGRVTHFNTADTNEALLLMGPGATGPGLAIDTNNGVQQCSATVQMSTVVQGAAASPAVVINLDGSIYIANGSISGLPATGGDVLAPYPKQINVSIDVSNFIGTPKVTWSLWCPPNTPVPVASETGTEFDWSFWVGANMTVDPFDPYGNKPCKLGVLVETTSGQQPAYAETLFTARAPPILSLSGLPYSAGPLYPGSVALNASASLCANEPCVYSWRIACPDRPAIDLAGKTAVLTTGAGAMLDPFNPIVTTKIECNMDAKSVDSKGQLAALPDGFLAAHKFTIYPPGPVARAGGPYTVPGGQPAALNGSASSCDSPPCSWTWVVACPNQPAIVRSGLDTTITTGPTGANATYDVNTFGLSAPLVCQVQLSGIALTPLPRRCGAQVVLGPPICSNQTVSYTAVASPNLSIRRGKKPKAAQAVFVPGFRDPQGNPVLTRIVGAVANQGESACRCRASSRDNCTCVPDVMIMPGGQTAQIVPSLTPRLRSWAAAGGRVYRLLFRGVSAATGLSCEGTAEVCVNRRPRRRAGGAADACAAFASYKTVRDATLCANFTRRGAAVLSDADFAADAADPAAVFRKLGIAAGGAPFPGPTLDDASHGFGADVGGGLGLGDDPNLVAADADEFEYADADGDDDPGAADDADEAPAVAAAPAAGGA
ncbi:MAG: hypothetical protein J3K34DRAFT_478770 [Monoraphidium minutum]|nr:MAG: hypothetical protein J3K34DRAFT_478770 [Monoraphidium minutum]